MPQTTHDIYESRKTRSPRDELFRRDGKPSDENFWTESLKRQRRQSFIIGLVVFLVVSMVIVITFQQYLLGIALTYDPPPAPAAPRASDSLNIMTYLNPDDDEQAQFMLTEILEQGVGDRAITDGDKPLDTHWVKEASYHLLRAERAQREGLEEMALESYENALRIYPDLRGVNSILGMLYMNRREHEQAAAAFERAALEETLSFGIVNNLGVAYLQLGRFDKAAEYLLHALRLRPDYAAAHFNLASLYVRTGEIDEAANHFRAFLEMEPDNLNAMLAYSAILIRRKEWAPAAELLQRAALQSPQSPPIHFRLAQCLSHVDRQAEALQTLRRAVALVDSRNALAWMSQSGFDAMRHEPGFQQLAQELGDGRR